MHKVTLRRADSSSNAGHHLDSDELKVHPAAVLPLNPETILMARPSI